MDSTFFQVLTTETYSGASLSDDAFVCEKGCFVGSRVDEVSLSENGYIFSERLGAGEYGEVFRAQLRQNQLRQYAIKKVKSSSPLAKRYSENELMIVEKLRSLQHPNIIGFHGYFDSSSYRFLIFQLGDISFDQFLDNNLEKLNLNHVNEILYQLISMVEALSSLELQADDFNKKNMVFCNSDKKIKLIDFEKYLTSTSVGFISPLVPLPLVGLEVAHIQLELNKAVVDHSQKAKLNFSRAARIALKTIYSNGEPSLSSNKLFDNTINWNKDLPEASKKLIAALFDSAVDFKDCILSMKESLPDRVELP